MAKKAKNLNLPKETEKWVADLTKFPEENPNPVMRTSLDGKLLYANSPAKALLKDMKWREGGLLPDILLKPIQQVIKQGKNQEFEIPCPPQKVYSFGVAFVKDAGYINLYGSDITERKTAEDALRRNREDLNRAQTVGNIGSWRMDVQKNELTWSDENHRIFGIPAGTAMGYETFLSIIPPDDREYVDKKWKAALAGEHYDIEHRIVVNGQIRWVRERAELEFDKDGELLGGFGTTQDITERKNMELLLRQARDELERRVLERTAELKKTADALEYERKRFEDVLEMMPAYAVLLTPDYRIAYANHTFREWFGDDNGKKCYEFLFNRIEPCEICETYTVLKTNKPHFWEWTGPNGRNYDIYDYPFTDSDGSPLIMEVGVDITAHKQSQAELHRVSLYTRNLIEASLDPLVTISRDGKITDVNEATIKATGVPRKQLIGTDFSNYFTEPDKAQAGYQLVFKEGLVRDYPLQIRHIDGHTTPVLYNASIYRDEAGNVTGVFAAARDITERKLAEAELDGKNIELQQRAEQLARLASELTLTEQRERHRLAQVLHDHLQQLLVGAKFGLEVLGRKAKDNQQKDSIREIHSLLKESIAASRSLTVELSPPILHEAGLTTGLEWLARWMEEKHGLTIELDTQEITSEREDVRILLFQSVRELLLNIVKHAGVTAAKVEVSRVNGDDIQVVVSDKGVGFDPEKLSRPGGEDTGFGLFSIRERLSLLGGQLKIESKPRQGAKFTLTAPALYPEDITEKKPQPVAAAAVMPVPAEAATGGKISVVLADDHTVMRQGLCALLNHEPDIEIVGQAVDGKEAVEMALSLHPDVILMDFSMPRMNGLEATKIINTQLPHIRIIGLSMYDEIDRADAMLEAGAVAYASKSGEVEKLLSLIRKHSRKTTK
ncbi:MAG: PAS domain S-box protein [Phycisphaerae bacterium]|nr:PAS domain S-box protein [Phycisphaerae bacterium]